MDVLSHPIVVTILGGSGVAFVIYVAAHMSRVWGLPKQVEQNLKTIKRVEGKVDSLVDRLNTHLDDEEDMAPLTRKIPRHWASIESPLGCL